MIPLDQALTAVLDAVSPLPSEDVPLAEAAGRTLAQDVVATWNLPPFDNSAMDGYAVRSDDTAGATQEQPVTLAIVARVVAGQTPEVPLEPGQAARIMTGAEIPDGADAVVRQEDVTAAGDAVTLSAPVAAASDLRRQGEDAGADAVLLTAGS